MKVEKAYDFRKKLLTIHEENIRDKKRKKEENEFLLSDNVRIKMSASCGEVTRTAVYDFIDFLKVSMNINVEITENEKAEISVSLASDVHKDLGEYAVYRGFEIDADTQGISVCGYDERGIAQALFYIEDVFTFEKIPAITFGNVKKRPLFSPQMVHSGYGLDNYPDEYLMKIAHEGRDAILVFTKSVNQTPDGYLDFNDLIKRAKKYGIDVYAYSYMKSEMNPLDIGAEEYYDGTYGKLFKECPELKGVTLVGESVAFPSNDPNVASGETSSTATADDGIPSHKNTSGYYPCDDYPDFLNMLKKVIRKHNKDADIVFWTYNWGFQPEEVRVKLIENLPTDITIQATYEMFEPRIYGNSVGKCADYTLSFAGPGKYFESEAKAAKRRGLKLYSMTNTGGLTWDLGVIPYQPMPYQWMKRYETMRKANEEWGLCGIMESHHYGFYPSVISKLSKWSFWAPYEDMEEVLKRLIKSKYGEENLEKVNSAFKCFSKASALFVPSDADQYGVFRVGPSYPLCLGSQMNVPCDEKAMFGNRIICPIYADGINGQSPLSIRIHDELKSLELMKEQMAEGLRSLNSILEKNEKLMSLINLSQFIFNTVETGIRAKKLYILKCRMATADSKEELESIYSDVETIINEEKVNVKDTIPLVEADSRLGWEPSMLYMTNKKNLEWKLRQLDYVLNYELPLYRKTLSLLKTDYSKYKKEY